MLNAPESTATQEQKQPIKGEEYDWSQRWKQIENPGACDHAGVAAATRSHAGQCNWITIAVQNDLKPTILAMIQIPQFFPASPLFPSSAY